MKKAEREEGSVKRLKNVLGPFALFFGALALDQASKYAFEGVQAPSPQPLLFFAEEINYAFAFSLPFRSSLWFVGLGFFAVLLTVFLWKTGLKGLIVRFGLALLLAGGVGNALDRLLIGGVRDFIQIRDLAAFNLADIWVLLGLLLLAYREWVSEKEKKMTPSP